MQTFVIEWYDQKRWKSVSVKAESIKNLRARIYKDYLMKGFDNIRVSQFQKNDNKMHWIGTAFMSSEKGPMYQITNFTNGKNPQTYRLSSTGELLNFDRYWRYI